MVDEWHKVGGILIADSIDSFARLFMCPAVRTVGKPGAWVAPSRCPSWSRVVASQPLRILVLPEVMVLCG
jgi:hypothetical protein